MVRENRLRESLLKFRNNIEFRSLKYKTMIIKLQDLKFNKNISIVLNDISS